MGGNGKESDNWAVMDGPFRRGQWELRVRDTVDEPTYLRRQFRSDPLATSLPTQKDVEDTLDATPFDVAPWNENSASGFRNMAEGWIPPRYNPEMYIPRMHNRVHAWVGGSMVPITSPNDPVFFLHHCCMDKLWADWQVLQFQRGGTRDYSPYLPDGGAAPGHNLNDEMSPWYKLNPPVWFGQSPWDVRYHHGPLGYSYNTDSDMQYTRYPSDVGDRLTPGQQISSSKDGNYYLVYQADGNLELWQHAPSGIKLWESGTAGRPGSSCKLEGNGTLVIYGADYKTPIWASSSHGSDNAYRLLVRNDGKVAIYQPDGKQLWSVPPPPVGNP